ncbi:hypothetical protein BDA99DRAFT_566948 [Phascolomyces articulosus]|uniref:Uncharacterized protein n=1 Tax=Phascolomyces articulosus TaxID=60185 RepID=A0AAD5JVI4_9FUNG|nr:hypothetical protein BDA99DRAFT_566948 [Phascolomyces articulosus]
MEGGTAASIYADLVVLKDMEKLSLDGMDVDVQEKKLRTEIQNAVMTLQKLQEYVLVKDQEMEFYTEKEIQERKAKAKSQAQSEDNGRNHYHVPKDLPVMQIAGSNKWHANKVVHLSAEMFLHAFEKELRAYNLAVEKQCTEVLNQMLDETVQFISGLQLDDRESKKRPRDEEQERRPAKERISCGACVVDMHMDDMLPSDKNIKYERVGTMELLDVWYNGRNIKHSFEVMNLANNKTASIGKNLFNEFGIGYTGLTFQWKDSVEEVKEKEVEDEIIPNNAPAGLEKEQVTFQEDIKLCLEKNALILKDSFCPLPQAVITLPTPPNVICYRKQFNIAYKQQPIINEAIEKWLKEGVITELPADADRHWNNLIVLAPKKGEDGKLTGHRPCLDPRLLNNHLEDEKYSILLESRSQKVPDS